MNVHSQQLSYAAGSSSRDPYGYRMLDTAARHRLRQAREVFPLLGRFFNSSGMVISGYPAALGLAGAGPLVDTYLHATTCLRAFRLAAIEQRPVVFVSQPLWGAEQLLELCREDIELPRELLWAVGGYYLPISLETAVREWLARRNCRLTCLYAYGVAEIGHTCFAAMERLPSGSPSYQQIADEIEVTIVGEGCLLTLRNAEGRTVETGDSAYRTGKVWAIENSPARLAPSIRHDLEQWSPEEWTRCTGYVHAETTDIWLQRRKQAAAGSDPREVTFYDFYERFGGSFLEKPKWHVQAKSVGSGG